MHCHCPLYVLISYEQSLAEFLSTGTGEGWTVGAAKGELGSRLWEPVPIQ